MIAAAKLPLPGALRMDENLTAFADCLGGCERILRTPIPLSYTRRVQRAAARRGRPRQCCARRQ